MTKTEDLLNTLRDIPLFRNLSENELNDLINQGSVGFYELGDIILMQGRHSDGFCIITKGKARLLDCEKPVNFELLKKGAYFGDQSLVFNEPTDVTVRASGKLSIFKLPPTAFFVLLENHPEIKDQLCKDIIIKREAFFLKGIELFSKLKLFEIESLLTRIETINLKKGEYLFYEGDEGDAAYVICQGKIQIEIGESKRIVFIPRTGDFFGEMSIVQSQPRNASAKAREDTKIYRFSREICEDLMPKIKNAIDEIVARRELQHKAFRSEEKKNEEEEEVNFPEFHSEAQLIASGLFKRKINVITTNK